MKNIEFLVILPVIFRSENFFFRVKEIYNTHAWEFQNELYFGHIKMRLIFKTDQKYIYTQIRNK